MSSPSNLYAEKVFAEHPSALYALDDVANYISLIDEVDRNVSLWTLDNATASLDTNVVDEPFIDSHTTRLFGDVPTGQTLEVSAISPEIVNLASLNSELGTFSVGGYFYTESAYLSKIKIGYEYTDSETSQVVQIVKDFSINFSGMWMFVSETFQYPTVEEDIRIVFKIEYFEGGVESDYEFLVNGITAGQWSEEFQSSSLGSDVVPIPEDIAIDTAYGVRAEAYGLQDLPGYYLVENNSLLAKNTGMPMVYGASNITKISQASDNQPSLIIPGLGFLNNSGKYKDYTFEFWLRIDTETTEPKRIAGPISSTDGIYVDGPFLKLKINDQVGAHYVGEWYRPMLVQVRYIDNNATMLINGEDVIFLEVSTASLSLPDKYNAEGQDQDWIGFYSYSDVYEYEIDCPAIYDYQVPAVVGKRRWVYGQGVEYPENINQTYSGESVFIDYSFANYANNYNYPDIGKWDNGISDNMLTGEVFMGTPEYLLPTVAFDNRSSDDWFNSLLDVEEGQTPLLSLCPNEEWEETEGHILFSNLNFLNDGTSAFFGVFEEKPGLKTGYQVLFSIKDKRANNFLEATLLDGEIKYSLDYEGTLQTLKVETGIDTTEKFVAGIDFTKIQDHFGGNVAEFLGNIDGLALYIGGSFNFIDGFYGNIHSVNFLNLRNLTETTAGLSAITDGIILTDEDVSLYETIKTSYRFKLVNNFDTYSLGFETSSYWQDYLPLSYFGKYIDNISNEKVYTLDFLQFNIDYPAPTKTLLGNYDTTNSPLKTYVTFSDSRTATSFTLSDYVNSSGIPQNNVVEPDNDWRTTKYEVCDGTIIYLPPNVPFASLVMSMHIEAYSKNAQTDKFKIRRIQVASQALSETGSNSVNTRFGNPLYPYTKTGYYFDYKSKNPFKIYKDTSPYLYLTKSSGIKVMGDQNPKVSRGLSIPLNKNLSADYKVIAIQAGIYYDKQYFGNYPVQVMEIQGRSSTIKFFAESIDPTGRRAKIYGVNASTGAIQNNIAFFWNGKLVKNAIVTAKEWGMLGISFGQQLVLNSSLGAIRLTGDFVFNNISHYKSTNLQEVQQISNRTWQRVKTLNLIDLDWSYWYPAFTWNQVLVTLPSIFYGIDPSDIYATFTGTNKLIVDDERALMVKDYEYNAYGNIISEIQVISAA